MKYIEYLNTDIKKEVLKSERPVLFGQNINAGSCLGGLTRGIEVQPGGHVINSTNTENSLVGFGLGLMLNGAVAAFFMKQMDFLLLGIDQLVNTYNIIRSIEHQPKEGSFTIVATVVDSGFEGPQSSLNNFADFCSIARIPGFAVTNIRDVDYIFSEHFLQPGFRIIGVSQRLGKSEIIDPGEPTAVFGKGSIFQYAKGKDATLVSFNFSFPQVHSLRMKLEEKGIKVTHFNVNSSVAVPWNPIIENIRATERVIVVDDSKSKHIAADSLLAELAGTSLQKKIMLRRELGEDWLYPTSDVFEIDEGKIVDELKADIMKS